MASTLPAIRSIDGYYRASGPRRPNYKKSPAGGTGGDEGAPLAVRSRRGAGPDGGFEYRPRAGAAGEGADDRQVDAGAAVGLDPLAALLGRAGDGGGVGHGLETDRGFTDHKHLDAVPPIHSRYSGRPAPMSK